MTSTVLNVAPFIAMVKPMFRAFRQRVSNAIEAYLEARMRKAQREIDRYRPMMHAGSLNHRGYKGHTRHQRSSASNARLYR